MFIRIQSSLCIIIFAVVSLVQSRQEAVINSTAQEIVGKWQKAVHASPWTKSMGAVLSSTSNEDGIPADFREWVAASGAYHAVINRTYDSSEIVINDESAVERDWNGFLRNIRGKELRRIRTGVFEHEVMLFGPPTIMADATVIASDDHTAYALRFNVPGGEATTWYIDRNSWLPIKSVRSGDDSEIITSYEDWRETDGMLTPHRGRVSETNKPDYLWERKSVHFTKNIDTKNFEMPSSGYSDTFIDSTAKPIPFNFENNHIIFKVSLNGRDSILFLFDTGANEEVINQPHLAEFGLEPYGKTTATGGGGSADYSYARGATFRLPGIEIRNQHVAILDESGLERAYGMSLGGILGYDFISRFVVEIDYEKSQLTLHEPKSWSYHGDGLIVPVTFDGGIPFTDGKISVPTKPSIPAYLLLDFGAAETMTLTSPFVKSNDLLTLAGTNSAVNRLAGLENQFFAQSNVRGHIDQLRLGKLTVDSFPVNLSVNSKGAYASSNFSGTVGEGIYHRYHVFLDYARDRIIFEPTAETGKPYPERRTYGLTLLASGTDLHTYTVAAVRPDSPAEKDGFKKSDVISGLGKKSASNFTLGELRDQLSHDNTRVELKIARDKVEMTKSIVVRLVSLDKK